MKAAHHSYFETFDLDIARTRVVLSLLAMLSLYIDPAAGGMFHLAIRQ